MTDKIKPIGISESISINYIQNIRPREYFKDVKDMTEDERADEIVRRLSQPYKTLDERLEDEILAVMSAEITKEIDNEIIKELQTMYGGKKHSPY